MSNKRYRVGILGAGRIAQGFDHPDSPAVLTVSHAIQQSPTFSIGGYFDIDPRKAESAERKWNVQLSPRDRDGWFAEGWDVIYIATPDACHANDLKEAIPHKPLAIWLEKPLALETSEGESALAAAKKADIPVLLNYPRRWHSGVAQLERLLQEGKLGTLQFGAFIYSGGAAHNGVHLFDLFGQLFGNDWDIQVLSTSEASTHLQLSHASLGAFPAIFKNIPANQYYAFEMRLYLSRGKIELGGTPEMLDIFNVQADPVYPDFNVCQSLLKFNITAEPLLLKALEGLQRIIEDSQLRAHHVRQENSRQQLVGRWINSLKLQGREGR